MPRQAVGETTTNVTADVCARAARMREHASLNTARQAGATTRLTPVLQTSQSKRAGDTLSACCRSVEITRRTYQELTLLAPPALPNMQSVSPNHDEKDWVQ